MSIRRCRARGVERRLSLPGLDGEYFARLRVVAEDLELDGRQRAPLERVSGYSAKRCFALEIECWCAIERSLLAHGPAYSLVILEMAGRWGRGWRRYSGLVRREQGSLWESRT